MRHAPIFKDLEKKGGAWRVMICMQEPPPITILATVARHVGLWSELLWWFDWDALLRECAEFCGFES